MKTNILATTLLLALVGAAHAQQPNQERAVTGDVRNRHPRWLPTVWIDTTEPRDSLVEETAIAVDSRNIVHAVASDGRDLLYYTTEFGADGDKKRRSNGFTEGNAIDSGGAGFLGSDPDIAVGPGATAVEEAIHVVYTISFPGAQNIPGRTSLFYQKRTGASWGGQVVIGETTPDQNYRGPVITVDGSGTAHVAAEYQEGKLHKLVYFTVSESGSVSRSEMPVTGDASGLRIASGAGTNFPVVVAWQADDEAKYAIRVGSGWSPSGATLGGGRSPDVAVDRSDNDQIHFAWVGDDDKAKYRKGAGGTTETVSAGQVFGVRLAVDSRKQPHIVWHDGGYAVKLNRPDIKYPSSGPWPTRQEEQKDSYHEGELRPWDLVVAKNDTLHLSSIDEPASASKQALYSRTLDYNLGGQDGFAFAGVGPGAQVNAVNGNLLMGLPLFSSRGVGFSASLGLTYNSLLEDPGAISQGWTHSYHMYLVDSWSGLNETSDHITLFMPDGRGIVFEWKDGGTGEQYHVAPDEFGNFARIERETEKLTTRYKMTTKLGVEYLFEKDGKLIEIKDRNGNALTLTYDDKGLLEEVTDSAGRTVSFTHSDQGQLTQVVDPAGATYSLEYDDQAIDRQLKKVTLNVAGSADKQVWEFLYHAQDGQESGFSTRRRLLKQVKSPRGKFTKYYYLKDNRFQASTDPMSNDTVVEYFDPADPTGTNRSSTRITDRRGKVWKKTYEIRKCLVTQAADPLGETVTRKFSFDAETAGFRNLIESIDQDGNKTKYTYTHEEGAKETPEYVKDNVRKVIVPSVNALSGGASASVTSVEYTYEDEFPLVSTSKTLNPAGSGTVTTSYEYDGSGNLTKITYPTISNAVTGGSSTPTETFQYDGQGRATVHISPEGGRTTTTYGGNGGLPDTITAAGRARPETFAYDAMGNVTFHKMPESSTGTATGYDGLYRATSVSGPSGDQGSATTQYQYDADGNCTRVDHPNGGVTLNQYDDLGRLTSSSRTDGGTTSYGYDEEGNQTSMSDALSRLTTRTFDARGQVVRESTPTVTTVMKYTGRGEVRSRSVGGDTTTMSYNARGGVRTTAMAAGGLTDETEYLESGHVLSQERRGGGVFASGTAYEYDARGSVVKTTSMGPVGLTTRFGLDKNGNRTQVKDPTGRIFTSLFDAGDRQVAQLNAGGAVISATVYDSSDRVVETRGVNPVGGIGLVRTSLRAYNDRDEVKISEDVFGARTSYTYKVSGEVMHTIDPSGVATAMTYDTLGRMTTQLRDGLLTQYGYDLVGNRTLMIDPRGFAYGFSYDADNRMTGMTYPGGVNTEVWGYDFKGRLTLHIDQRGVSDTHFYDALDREVRTLYTVGTAVVADLRRSYDAAGNLVETLDVMTQISKRQTTDAGLPGYDAYNRMTDSKVLFGVTELGGAGTLWRKEQVSYWDDGQRKDYTFQVSGTESHTYRYEYDLEGRLSTIERTLPTPAKTYSTFTYDAAGRKREQLFGNATRLTWGYDLKGRVQAVRAISSTYSTLASFTYEYNVRDERTRITYDHLGVVADFTYDAHSRLTSESWTGNAQVYPFQNTTTSQPFGNESAFQGPASGVPAGIGTFAGSYWAVYGYDPNGNRTLKQTSGGTSQLAYDGENRLTLETRYSVSGAGTPAVAASSTDTGYSTSVIADGVTTDGTGTGVTWKSAGSGPHTVEFDYGSPQSLIQATLHFPSLKMPGKFKVEYWTGTAWALLPIQAVTGAQLLSGGGGFYKAIAREVRFGFGETGAQKLRYWQDAAGGGILDTGTAYLTEFTASVQSSPLTTVYDYTLFGQAGKNPNLSRRTVGTTEEYYGYDYQSRLVAYVKLVSGSVAADYAYNYLPTGERLLKINNLSTSSNEEWYYSDGSDVVADYSRSSGSSTFTLTSTYVNGPSIDSKAARIKADGTELYYIADALGSVHRVINASEAILNTTMTTAWGEDHPAFTDSIGQADRYGFTGREVDAESNLMHYRARSYDPHLGRFMQKDPARMSWNPYLYASNAPGQNTDPLGLFDFNLHDNITRDALMAKGINVAPGVRDYISVQAMAPDLRGPSHEQSVRVAARINEAIQGEQLASVIPTVSFMPWVNMHFDDLPNTKAVENAWKVFDLQFTNAMNTLVNGSDEPGVKFLKIMEYLGHSLHAVEDFYSHSNYLELSQAAGVQVGAIPTWFDPNAKAHITKITKGSELWTGAVELPEVGQQPNHWDKGANRGLNKDNPSRGATLHADARSLATRAASDWYKRALLTIPDAGMRDLLATGGGAKANATLATRAAGARASATNLALELGKIKD